MENSKAKRVFTPYKRTYLLAILMLAIGAAALLVVMAQTREASQRADRDRAGLEKGLVELNNGYSYWRDSDDTSQPEVTDELKRQLMMVEGVKGVSSYKIDQFAFGVFCQGTNYEVALLGIDADYMDTASLEIRQGRTFQEEDYSRSEVSVLMDETAAHWMFAGDNPVGREIEINGVTCTVIGTVAEQNPYEPEITSMEDYDALSLAGADMALDGYGILYVPKTAWAQLYETNVPDRVLVQTDGGDDMLIIGDQAATKLNRVLDLPDSQAYRAVSRLSSPDYASPKAEDYLLVISCGIVCALMGIAGICCALTEQLCREKPVFSIKLYARPVLAALAGVALGALAAFILCMIWQRLHGQGAYFDLKLILLAVYSAIACGLVAGQFPIANTASSKQTA